MMPFHSSFPMCFNSRPLEEVDPLSTDIPAYSLGFNSRPLEEVDLSDHFPFPASLHVSIHDLSKRSTHPRSLSVRTLNVFQFTTSRRGRPPLWKDRRIQEEFQFTTSRRGRPGGNRIYCKYRRVSIHDLSKRSTGQSG